MFYITSLDEFCKSNAIDDARRDAGLTTPEGIRRFDNLRYGEHERHVLDVYRPKHLEGKLPVIVSVHGGGWVYGDKELMQYYCMSLAEHGFAVVNFSYRLAPDYKHPVPLEDTNSVFYWVLENAVTYGFDTDNIFALGDSCGANMLGLYCCLCTDPAYAKELSIKTPDGFVPRAVALNSGLYRLVRGEEDLLDSLAEAYFPNKGTDEEYDSIALAGHVNGDFPPTFVMTALGDFLVPQAKPFYEHLRSLGVEAEYHCYGTPENELRHVFHVDIKLPEARACNEDECTFFRNHMKNSTAAFVMPVRLSGNERELNHFRLSVESIKNQTDSDWVLIMVDDRSDNQAVYDVMDEMKEELKDKLHVIYSETHGGTGAARNRGVRYAGEIGAPFILFNDSDDLSDPKRLELVRKAFESDNTVNVVYTSFDVIDENGDKTPHDRISPTVREIIDGHTKDVVEGENAWTDIVSKKKYTNLTSCTCVRTSLALAEPFPKKSVSEDSHTWMSYGAHPGKFVFLREIKGKYRICSNVDSRSRSENTDFYGKMAEVDSDGFEEALKRAKKYGTMGGWNENDLRAAFYVRLALTLLHAESVENCRKYLSMASAISAEKTSGFIDALFCESEDKSRMKALIK